VDASLKFSKLEFCVCISHLPYACYKIYPSHLSWSNYLIPDKEHTLAMKFFIMFFSPPSCYLLPLRLKHSHQHYVLKHSQPMSHHKKTNWVSLEICKLLRIYVNLTCTWRWGSVFQQPYSSSSGPWHPWLQWVPCLVQSDTGKRFRWPETRDFVSLGGATTPALRPCGWHRLVPWRSSWDTSCRRYHWSNICLHHWSSIQASPKMWQILVSIPDDLYM